MAKIRLLLLFLLLPLCLYSQNTDCNRATTLCNTATFSGNSSGFGTQELNSSNRGCLVNNESQSSWYRMRILTPGVLSFMITPSANSDYDFALYRTSNCGSLGTPVRCSYARPPCTSSFLSICISRRYETGLRADQTDVSEGASGNGYVDTVRVRAGEVYYLLIDNFTADFNSFVISFNGTTATLDCVPFFLSNFQGIQTGNNVTLDWKVWPNSLSHVAIYEKIVKDTLITFVNDKDELFGVKDTFFIASLTYWNPIHITNNLVDELVIKPSYNFNTYLLETYDYNSVLIESLYKDVEFYGNLDKYPIITLSDVTFETDTKWSIYSLNGKLLVQGNSKTINYNEYSLSSGVYILFYDFKKVKIYCN